MNSGTTILEKDKNTQFSGITPNGIWLLSNGKELFINFKDYPEFKDATVSQIQDFSTDISGNLHWKSIDVDIEIEALENPEKFPMKYSK